MTITVRVSVTLHPFIVMVRAYVPDVVMVITEVVLPVFHRYVAPVSAVTPIAIPVSVHTVVSAPNSMTGIGLKETVIVSLALHPFSETLTQYVPGLSTEM